MKHILIFPILLLYTCQVHAQGIGLFNEVRNKNLKGKIKSVVSMRVEQTANTDGSYTADTTDIHINKSEYTESGILKTSTNQQYLHGQVAPVSLGVTKIVNGVPESLTFTYEQGTEPLSYSYSRQSDTCYSFAKQDKNGKLESSVFYIKNRKGRLIKELNYHYLKDGKNMYTYTDYIYSKDTLVTQEITSGVLDKDDENAKGGKLTITYTYQEWDERGNPTVTSEFYSNSQSPVLYKYVYTYYE